MTAPAPVGSGPWRQEAERQRQIALAAADQAGALAEWLDAYGQAMASPIQQALGQIGTPARSQFLAGDLDARTHHGRPSA